MKKFSIAMTTMATVFALTIGSCSKDDNNNGGTETDGAVEMSTQKAISDALYDDVSMEVLQANTQGGLNGPETVQQTCATISITPQDPGVWPKTVTIDYGTTGCVGLNGFTRKGKLIYTISQRLLNTGAVLEVSFDNYSVNGYKLEGQYRITNNGSANGLNITSVLTNGKVTNPNGVWYTKTTNTTWVQSAGQGTLNILDDEYNVTGTGTFTNMDGDVLTAASKTNLLHKVGCNNTVSGLLDFTFNRILGVLDFGSGTCDKNAVITVAGKDYAITLP